MKNKITLLAISLVAFTGSLSAQGFVAASNYLADITYGYDTSVFDTEPFVDTWGRIFDSTGTTPLAQNDSVSAIGYFTTVPSSWSANIGIFDDFVFLAQGNVEVVGSTAFPGDFNNTEPNVDVNAAIGKTPYFAVFKGITDTANYASATEFALLSSGTWATLDGTNQVPIPAPPLQLAYTIGRTALGTGVYVGTEVDDTRFEADEGYNYYTALVPEPSAFSLLIGLSTLFLVARRR